MWKPAILLLFGFAVGVAATMWWTTDRVPLTENAVTEFVPPPTETEHSVTPIQGNNTPTEQPTLADINALSSDFEQTLGLYELMRDMSPNDLLALLDEASLITGPDYVAATSIIVGRLAELDPEKALERALNSATLAQPAWIHAIFASWSRLDADAARDALDSLPTGFAPIAQRGINRSSAIVQTPLATIGVSASSVFTSPGVGIHAPTGLAANTDLPTAWQEAMNIADSQQRVQALAQIAVQWSLTDPQAALQASEAMPADGMRQAIQQQIVMRWAQSEPRAVFEWVRNAPQTRQTTNMMQAAVQVLAQTDFAEAQLLVDSLEPAQGDQARLGLLTQWAQQDIEGLKSWLASQTNQRVRQQAIQQVTVQLVNEDPQAARNWLADLPESESAMGTTIAVAMLANMDINRAAEFVDSIDQTQARNVAAQSLIQQWSRFSPDDAAEWIENQGGDRRPELYRSLTQSWGNNAPDEALAFAERLLDASERDHALAGVLPFLSEDQQQQTMNQIQDDEVRNQSARLLNVRAIHR